MIYTLYGTLSDIDIEESSAVIVCGGVGYKLTVTANTLSSLPTPEYLPDGELAPSGKSIRLYTHMAVKDDGIGLFGFFTKDELSAFKLLVSVSGIGPKAAISILSLLTPQKLALAVASEDSKSISRAPGVGAKTAARIILELKEKLEKAFPNYELSDSPLPKSPTKRTLSSGKLTDATDALAVLGYSRSEIASAMKNVDMNGTVEEIIKASLAVLMKT